MMGEIALRSDSVTGMAINENTSPASIDAGGSRAASRRARRSISRWSMTDPACRALLLADPNPHHRLPWQQDRTGRDHTAPRSPQISQQEGTTCWRIQHFLDR